MKNQMIGMRFLADIFAVLHCGIRYDHLPQSPKKCRAGKVDHNRQKRCLAIINLLPLVEMEPPVRAVSVFQAGCLICRKSHQLSMGAAISSHFNRSN